MILPWDNPAQRTILEGLPKAAYVAISPDVRWVAAGCYQGSGVKIWESSGKPHQDLPVRGNAGVAFSPDGRWLVITPAYGAVRFVLAETLAEIATFPARGVLCVSPDGGRMVTAVGNQVVQVWDLGRIRAQLQALRMDWSLP